LWCDAEGFQIRALLGKRAAELWIPMAFGEHIHDRGGNSLRVFARLKPGVSFASASA